MNIFFNKKHPLILVLIIVLFSLLSCNPCTNSESPEVAFSDGNFENAIRGALDKPDSKITKDDMLTITMLSIGYRDIIDINGIEYCKNIQILDLEHNQIQDIHLLEDLTQLWYLRLRNNNIHDISSLSKLVNLKELILNYNHIEDISAVTGLKNLIKLDLLHNQIQDIRPIILNSDFKNGDTVELRNNPLGTTSINMHIPQLLNRGVVVHYTKSALLK